MSTTTTTTTTTTTRGFSSPPSPSFFFGGGAHWTTTTTKKKTTTTEKDDDDDDENDYSYDEIRVVGVREDEEEGLPEILGTTDDDGNKNSFTHISPAETVDEVVVRNAATRTPFATVKTTSSSSFGTVSSTKKKRERTMSGNARTDEQRVTKYAGDFDDVASSNGEISRIRVTSMARKYRSRKRNDRETHDVRERQTAKRIARGSRVREFVRAMVFGGSVESVWKKHGIIHVDVESMFSHQTTRRRGWSYHAMEFSSGDGDEESRGGVSERVFGTFKA